MWQTSVKRILCSQPARCTYFHNYYYLTTSFLWLTTSLTRDWLFNNHFFEKMSENAHHLMKSIQEKVRLTGHNRKCSSLQGCLYNKDPASFPSPWHHSSSNLRWLGDIEDINSSQRNLFIFDIIQSSFVIAVVQSNIFFFINFFLYLVYIWHLYIN